MIGARTSWLSACSALLCGLLGGSTNLPERQAAEWILREGGRVRVNGQRQPIDDLTKLPIGPFRLTAVDLVGTTIDPEDLVKLAGLSSLTELSLPGPIFTPFSDSPLDANAALKHLARLKHLQRLFFSLHFLPTHNVDDKGISYLASLTQLRELRLSQSSVKTPNLAPFVHLESLDLSDTPYFGDEGMATLETLKSLRRVYLRNAPITDEGLKHLRALTALEELDLYGTNLTDRRIASLRDLTAIRKLNLLGADVTDASVETLERMPHLRELNLYRSHVSNSGLSRLAGLKELRALDLRYSHVTEAGVDAFKTAQPQCSIEFAGGATPASGKAIAALPAGRSTKPSAIGFDGWAERPNSAVQG